MGHQQLCLREVSGSIIFMSKKIINKFNKTQIHTGYGIGPLYPAGRLKLSWHMSNISARLLDLPMPACRYEFASIGDGVHGHHGALW